MSTGSPGRGSGWRRSGDENYWDSLMSEVEILPPAPRPQSCVGGVGVEGWLQQLERAQALASAHAKMPPLSDRTVSMPTLQERAHFRHHPSQDLPSGGGPRKPFSCYGTPSGSEDDLFTPPGQWDRARFRNSPRAETVRVSALASVKNGWLPIQRRAVVCDITSHAPPRKESSCEDPYNPSDATSIPSCFIQKNIGLDYTDGKEREKSRTQASPRTGRLSGQVLPNIMQTSDRASLEGDSALGRERRKKEWEERRTAFFLDGIQSGDHDAVPQRHGLLHRTASAPVPPRTTALPVSLETLPTKPCFSSIISPAQRHPRSHTSLSNSGGTYSGGKAGSSEKPPANHPSEPVMRRRRVAAIKTMDTGRSHRPDETGPGAGPHQFRHSCGEGDGKENALTRFCQQGGADHARTSPIPHRPRSCSLGEPGRGGEKVYRSTLSLYLCRASSGGATEGDLAGPARPLSFAGAFRHADPSLGGPPDPTLKPVSCGSTEKPNAGCGRDVACSLNTQPTSVGQPGTGKNTESSRQDVGSLQGLGLHPGQSWSQHSATIKPQDSGTHQSAEAILALSAASIIASIKLQTRINKMANLLSEQESEKLHEAGNEMVENSGSYESDPPTGEVVRRVHGNAGRKVRPHPIYWQEPFLDQQEDNAAPLTLKEALELLRPEFIRRSQRRVKELEQRAQRRRAQQGGAPELESARASGRTRSTEQNARSDDRCKPGDRAAAGKETVLRSKRQAASGIHLRTKSSAPGIRRNRQEEQKKMVSQTNRQRAALFKMKLLDQILRRNMD